jgi:hypothetical protein
MPEFQHLKFSIELPYYVSANSMYIVSGRPHPRLNIDPKVWSLQETAALEVRKKGYENIILPGSSFYICRVNMVFGWDDWVTQSGDLRKIDLVNIWKPLEDAIFMGVSKSDLELKGLGMDDSKCIDLSLHKRIGSKGPPYVFEIDLYVGQGKLSPETFIFEEPKESVPQTILTQN